MFEIVFLGTSASAPSVTRGLSAQVVLHNEHRFLIDCGEGTQRQMLKSGLGFKRLDHVLITHGHLDHILGLGGLVSTFSRWEAAERMEIHAGPWAIERIRDLLLGVVLRGEKPPLKIEFVPLEPGLLMEDDKFHDACRNIVLYETTNGGHTTVADYLERNKDRHPNQVFYAEAGEGQATYLDLFKAEEMEALLTRSVLDSHFISFLESKHHDVKWSRVDSAVTDHLVDKDSDAKLIDAEGKTSDDRLKDFLAETLKTDELEIQVQGLKSAEVSGLITQGEQERRLKEMSALWQKDLKLPDRKTLVVNRNNPLVQKLLSLKDPDKARELGAHIYDLARLAHDGLKGDELARFIARSNRLLSGLE